MPRYKTSSKKGGSTNKTHKKFKPMNCSPIVAGNAVNTSSCFTPDIVLTLKTEFNKGHTENPIKTKDPREIWNQMKARLVNCEKEDCWLETIKDPSLRKKLDKFIFAPDQPPEWKDNPDEWLSNYDIFDVIRQYELTYPKFHFIGPTSIDFDALVNGACVDTDMCNFSLKYWKQKKKTKFGIIFNLDKHTQSGSHWVSLFIDLDNKFQFYFDSAGASEIPNEIVVFMDRVDSQSSELGLTLKKYDNRSKDHQQGSTECGMYSLFFIITMLTGKTKPTDKTEKSLKSRLNLFLKSNIPDKRVFDYRELYFNKK